MHVLNEEQLTASNPAYSVWVSAAAGTGKTKILVDRVLRLLLQNVYFSKILCLTFTKAAANEMQERILHILQEWQHLEDATLRNTLNNLTGLQTSSIELNRARNLFLQIIDSDDGLQIMTIHSFAQKILAKFAVETATAANITVLDDSQKKLLFEEAWQQLLQEIHNSKTLAKSIRILLSKSSDRWLEEKLTTLVADKSIELIDFFQYFDEEEYKIKLIADLEIDLLDEFEIKQQFLQNSDISTLKNFAQELDTPNVTEQKLVDQINLFLINPEEHLYSLCKFFVTGKGERRKKILSKKNHAWQDFIDNLQTNSVYFLDSHSKLETLELSMAFAKSLEQLFAIYARLKASKKLLDYNDLIYYTKNLLTNSDLRDWVIYKLDGGIEHVLIDEAQDTSNLQWQIIDKTVEEFFSGIGASDEPKSLFVVGDEKQSIYSFQGADPDLFNEKAANYKDKIANSNNDFKRINLNLSYRSVPQILNFVDNVFKEEELKTRISKQSDRLKHRSFKENLPGRVDIWPILNLKKTANTEKNSLFNNLQSVNSASLEAKFIASQIKNILSSQKILPGKQRQVKNSDILVLLRKRGQLMNMLIKELKTLHINVATPDRIKLLDDLITKDIISFLKFLDLPEDDLNLACLLKSSIFGLSEDDLQELCLAKKNNLLESLFLKSKHNEQYQAITENLTHFLRIANLESVSDILLELLFVKNIKANFQAEHGNRSNMIINSIIDLANKFDNISISEFLEDFQNNASDLKLETATDQDLVRVMTVHGSKGLQAPIVILADCASLPDSVKSSIYLDQDNLIFAPANNLEIIGKKKTAIAAKQYDEYMRLLYVALTRAEEELYISASSSQKISSQSWYHIMLDAIKQNSPQKIKLDIQDFAEYVEDANIYSLQPANNYQPKIQAGISEKFLPKIDKIFFEKFAVHSDVDIVEENKINAQKSSKQHDTYSKTRGIFIHRLIEIFANLDKQHWKNYFNYLTNDLYDVELKKILEIDFEKLKNSSIFDYFTGKDCYFEVPIIHKNNSYQKEFRIDCLINGSSEIELIDFKTSKNPPSSSSDINIEYIEQLHIYSHACSELFPHKTIKSYLYFLENDFLYKLENSKDILVN